MSGTRREAETSPLLQETWHHVHPGDGISPIIHEGDDTITVRRPLQYRSINADPEEQDVDTAATVNRYKYYGRLAPHSRSSLLMPSHVVPSEFFLVIPVKVGGENQSSLVTIFSIWNTMMGTSILSMPWALERAGFGCGITLMIVMTGLTLYTAYRVLKSPDSLADAHEVVEFTDICRYYLGRWGEYISVTFSAMALLGASIVYWVLMSNFLYNSVTFIYDKVTNEFNTTSSAGISGAHPDVFCPGHNFSNASGTMVDVDIRQGLFDGGWEEIFGSSPSDTMFRRVWKQYLTVPLFLIAIVFPLINFKSPTFFTKFNALGTVSVVYIMTFIIRKGIGWGVHMDMNPTDTVAYIPEFQWTFPALTGILSLALFIHNCVLSIMKNQRNPQHNGRDLSIAYCLVCITYVFIGGIFYVCFPLPKVCIEDNLLNNFVNSDIWSFVARLFLFFQMVTVFPLLMYIFRVQLFKAFFGNICPGLGYVLALNAGVIAICVLFAIFLPHIGNIIRFSGSLCGLVYIFTLPSIVYMLSRRQDSTLTWPVIAFHTTIILLGAANFISQFFI